MKADSYYFNQVILLMDLIISVDLINLPTKTFTCLRSDNVHVVKWVEMKIATSEGGGGEFADPRPKNIT